MLNLENRVIQVIAVLALAFFWGINWPIMKIGLEIIEPWTFRALLVLSGAVGCALLLIMRGESLRVPSTDWRMLALLALFQGVMWNGFSGFGISLIDAGRASILAFTMPVWATGLSILILKEEVTNRRLVALGFGMAGMLCLLYPALGAISERLWGTLCMLLAAMSWAMATVIFKAARWHGSLIAITGWHFALGSTPLILASLTFGQPSTLLEIDLRAGLALLFSATVAMVFCQLIWFTIVSRLPASLASMSTLLVPLIGVGSSAVMLGEQIGIYEGAALLLVFTALGLILPGLSSRANGPISK